MQCERYFIQTLSMHTHVYIVYIHTETKLISINIYINVTLTFLKFQFKKIDSMLLIPDLFSTQRIPAIVEKETK